MNRTELIKWLNVFGFLSVTPAEINNVLAPVANIAALQAIDITYVAKGTLIYVESPGRIYSYDPTNTLTADNYDFVAPAIGAGNWVTVQYSGSAQNNALLYPTSATFPVPMPRTLAIWPQAAGQRYTLPQLTEVNGFKLYDVFTITNVAANFSGELLNSSGFQFTGDIPSGGMGVFKIVGLGAPGSIQTLAIFSGLAQENKPIWWDQSPATTLINLGGIFKVGDTVTGPLLNYTSTPSAALELVPKIYVDSQIASFQAGLKPKDPCYAATTVNLVGSYINGASGVGATFTLTANGVFTTDGTTPPVSSRILMGNQSTQLQNGIYVLSNAGSVSTQAVLTRASDYDNSPSGEVVNSTWTSVENGNAYGGTSWYLSTSTTIIIGTTALVFSQLQGILAGTGLTKPFPNTFAIADLLGAIFSLNDASKTFNLSVNKQGQLTAITALAIAIASSQITDKAAANGVASLDAGAHLPAVQFPALTGDVTTVAGALAATLATVLSSPGTFNDASKTFNLTVNAKGLITAVAQIAIAIASSQIADASAAGIALLTAATVALQRTALGLGTIATQAASSVAITGGAVNNTPIGGTTPAAGSFTTLAASASLTFSGSNQSALSAYEFFTHTTNFTWNTETLPNIPVTCIRIGRLVTIITPPLTFTSTQSNKAAVSVTALPTRFIPSTNVVCAGNVTANSGPSQTSRNVIDATGIIYFQAETSGATGVGFTGTGLGTSICSSTYFV